MAGSRNESGSEFQTFGLWLRKPAGAECAAMKQWNIQFATAGRTVLLAAGNF